MPKIQITMTLDATDAEQSNFLARMTGLMGNVSDVVATSDGAPVGGDEGPVNTNAPSVDSAGLPWNADFHASSKATNADGTWRGKRGVDKAKLAEWEAKVKASQPATVTLPSFITGGAPVQLPNPDAPAVPGFPGFPAPVAAPVDIPVTYEQVTAAFAKLGALGLIAPDGSNVMPLYTAASISSGDQIATDETARNRLMVELRKAFPTAGL